MAHSYFGKLLIRVIWQSCFTYALIHANFISHTTSSPFPSPPTHDSLSLHNLTVSKEAISIVFAMPSHLFLSLLILKKRKWRHHQHKISWIITHNSNCKQTHRSTRVGWRWGGGRMGVGLCDGCWQYPT